MESSVAAERSPTSCPLCGGRAYGWISLPAPGSGATVGMISPVDPDEDPEPGVRLIDRCEECGTGIERGDALVNLSLELTAISHPSGNGSVTIAAPNRASLQAGIGSEGWAALNGWESRLLLTPRGLELLAEKLDLRLQRVRFRIWGRSQGWMWQTLMNGLTVHPNFASRVRSGELRPPTARSKFAFYADSIATVLAAPLVAIVSFPFELAAVVARRGGELVAQAERG